MESNLQGGAQREVATEVKVRMKKKKEPAVGRSCHVLLTNIVFLLHLLTDVEDFNRVAPRLTSLPAN